MTQPYDMKSFVSDNEVRWCPGCGDYAVLKAMQKFLPTTGVSPDNIVFISGIGCAGRFPYYMNVHGFHVIHGRALAVATGLSMTRPDLSIWVVTGDGDCLSIGAGHFIHALRRDLNINVLLLNNEIYGLTKGQMSPTSSQQLVTKTSPQGKTTPPLSAASLALSSGASFVGRGLDKDIKHLQELFAQAVNHQGTSFIEILQSCPIFNKEAYQPYENKNTRQDNLVYLSEEKMIFGQSKDKCLTWSDGAYCVSELVENASFYNPRKLDKAMALSQLSHPMPLGVLYARDDTITS